MDTTRFAINQEIRIYFKDEVNTCSMYRTFATIAEAKHAISVWEARNTPGQHRYYTASPVREG